MQRKLSPSRACREGEESVVGEACYRRPTRFRTRLQPGTGDPARTPQAPPGSGATGSPVPQFPCPDFVLVPFARCNVVRSPGPNIFCTPRLWASAWHWGTPTVAQRYEKAVGVRLRCDTRSKRMERMQAFGTGPGKRCDPERPRPWIL